MGHTGNFVWFFCTFPELLQKKKNQHDATGKERIHPSIYHYCYRDWLLSEDSINPFLESYLSHDLHSNL